MKYVIDAYNVIGKLDIISLADKDKEQRLKDWVLARMQGKRDKIDLVFDGYGDINEFGTTERYDSIRLIFTPIGESADDYIIRRCETVTQASSMTVVSSDRRIHEVAKSKKIAFLSSESFIRAYHPKKTVSEPAQMTDREVDRWLEAFDS